MKIIIILTVLVILGGGAWYLNNQPKPHTIEEFVSYLNAQGLDVREASISTEDKKFMSDFSNNYNNLQKAVGQKDTQAPNQPDEAILYRVGGINKVDIERYSSVKKAKLVYEEKLAYEKRVQDRVATNQFYPGIYFMTEYLYAGTFIITIRHYDVKLKDGKIDISSKHKLELPADDLTKLRTAVANWKE